MNKYIKAAFAVVFVLSFLSSFAQFAAAWNPATRTYNGTANSDDFAYSVAVDKRGNTYAAGQSTETSTGIDYQTVSYDEAGNLRWHSNYIGIGGSGEDVAKAVAVDDAGDVYVTGYSVNGDGNKDIVTVKYAGSNGDQLWATRWTPVPDPLTDEVGVDIAADNRGYVYVADIKVAETCTIHTII